MKKPTLSPAELYYLNLEHRVSLYIAWVSKFIGKVDRRRTITMRNPDLLKSKSHRLSSID